MDDARVKAFRALKPPCVELSQTALRYKGRKATAKDVIKALEHLHSTLQIVSRQANTLDLKLADYAFFPLSHIFRDSKDLPVRAVEVALQCLHILISYGWRGQLSSDLSKQLLILLSFLAGGSAAGAKVNHVNEEVSSAAFDCLASLFEGSTESFLGISSVESENIPLLGHTVTVVIDGITDGPSVRVRMAALTALDNIISSISDNEALKNVFPGIVSSLTKVLSSDSRSKPSYKVLVASLGALTKIVRKVIGDDELDNLTNTQAVAVTTLEDRDNQVDPWIAATSAQVKMALANIIRLRYHERLEVQEALQQLCTSMMQDCRRSLSQSMPMLTETFVVLCSQSSDTHDSNSFNFGSNFVIDIDLLEMMKSSLHNWIVALPRVMQSNGDTGKRRIMEQVSTAFKLLEMQHMSLDVLKDSMSNSLQASVSAAIRASSKGSKPVSESSLKATQLLQLAKTTTKSVEFSPVLLSESSNRATVNGLQRLVVQLKDLPMSTGLQQGIVNTLRNTSKDEQLASLWLSLQLLNGPSPDDSNIGQYLNFESREHTANPLLDDVYAFSLDVLSKSTFEDLDRWELQALALETVTLQARHQAYDFRPELVDALYPILERLGSSNAALQQHAMTCLSIVSNACEYPNSASLIIDNADYLVNAVALKLNTFDISPQAPQVLVMMVRLCGSALIPYLDDLVESIFAILACYHGYPKLVDSLFSVLNAIVEEAATSSTPAIKYGSDTTTTRPQFYKPTSIADLASILRSNLEQTTRPLSPPLSSPSPHPNQPFSTTTTKPTETNADLDPDLDLESEDQPNPPPDPPPPQPSKTHTLITSITSLTPAHLTTPSAPLRAHILTLLVSALPILASNTDTFLPIAATLWPAITARLYDSEAYITLAAANALSTLCECAGDFLAGRVEDEWEKLRRFYGRVEREMREEGRVQGKRRGMKWRVWDAVVGLVVCVVRNVGVKGEMEDGVFEMLGGWAGQREDVRNVLEWLNADALWLIEEKTRIKEGGEALVPPMGIDGVEFREFGL
ncbi:hypothetical protein MMC28_001485 [Mycoblastus sanguinarius]|nr:hypothetical protein [Mycoblastus sanguinarius]